ncbi:MAG: NAD(P)H-hydrate epimerase [Planctomycetota bacterium]|nr:MAG: NAD(P)H-hydrate epimerase [Planctomycetota bacterium]
MPNEKTAWEILRQKVLRSSQVRLVDRIAMERFHMHSLVLMEHAALGCAHWIRDRFSQPRRCVILCGRGNNGGDGLVVARHLRTFGWSCRTVVHGPLEALRADALANARILIEDAGDDVRFEETASQETRSVLQDAELIIDAMLGTGATGTPRPPYDAWILWANDSEAMRIAIDLPTGVDADSGESFDPSFRADATLTFVAMKPAMVDPSCQRVFGEVAVLPIGLPQRLMELLSTTAPESILDSPRTAER